MNEFKTPRFVLTAFFTITTTLAYFFTDKMSSDQYIMVMGVILGAYSTVKIVKSIKGKQ